MSQLRRNQGIINMLLSMIHIFDKDLLYIVLICMGNMFIIKWMRSTCLVSSLSVIAIRSLKNIFSIYKKALPNKKMVNLLKNFKSTLTFFILIITSLINHSLSNFFLTKIKSKFTDRIQLNALKTGDMDLRLVVGTNMLIIIIFWNKFLLHWYRTVKPG